MRGMQSKKILLLLGHPDEVGVCASLADAYEAGARAAGHEVARFDVGRMQFDPVLEHGYRVIQQLEPDLVRFQEALAAADHFVIIHPVWWSGMPAKLKGLFDRVWLPGCAYRYIKTKAGIRTMAWCALYRGKTARLIVTSGSPRILTRFLFGDPNRQLRRAILWFAGFSSRTSWFSCADDAMQETKDRWCATVRKLGEMAR